MTKMSDVFRFRLQKVLELREWRERERGAELASAQQAASDARALRDAMDAVHAAGLAQADAAHREGGSAGELQRLHAVIAQLEEHVQHADAATQEAERDALEALKEFTAAAQERFAIESLRERQQLAWRAARNSHEQKILDEVALTRRINAQPDGTP